MVRIAKEAVDRLSAKLAGVKGSGRPVDMAEEFRMLTLQVIGEAILSLPPEECDKARALVPVSKAMHPATLCPSHVELQSQPRRGAVCRRCI